MAAPKINTLTGDFIEGDGDDADGMPDREALGGRHRRHFGYTTAGAEENDYNLLTQGGHPMDFELHKQQNVGASRTKSFNHGVVGGIVR